MVLENTFLLPNILLVSICYLQESIFRDQINLVAKGVLLLLNFGPRKYFSATKYFFGRQTFSPGANFFFFTCILHGPNKFGCKRRFTATKFWFPKILFRYQIFCWSPNVFCGTIFFTHSTIGDQEIIWSQNVSYNDQNLVAEECAFLLPKFGLRNVSLATKFFLVTKCLVAKSSNSCSDACLHG